MAVVSHIRTAPALPRAVKVKRDAPSGSKVLGPRPRPGPRSGPPPVAALEVCAGRGPQPHGVLSGQGSPGSGGRRGLWSGPQGTVSPGNPLAPVLPSGAEPPHPLQRRLAAQTSARALGDTEGGHGGSTRAVLAPVGPSLFLKPVPSGVSGAVSSELTLNVLFMPPSPRPRLLASSPLLAASSLLQGQHLLSASALHWHLTWHSMPSALGRPLCVDSFSTDATLPLLRAWLCSGGDTDCPQQPVTHGVHAGDPRPPAMVRFRGTCLPRGAGPLWAGHPEPAATSPPAPLRERVRLLLLNFLRCAGSSVFVLCLLRNL